jgi:hypothetical protein
MNTAVSCADESVRSTCLAETGTVITLGSFPDASVRVNKEGEVFLKDRDGQGYRVGDDLKPVPVAEIAVSYGEVFRRTDSYTIVREGEFLLVEAGKVSRSLGRHNPDRSRPCKFGTCFSRGDEVHILIIK